MNYIYRIRTDCKIDEDGTECTVYGIEVLTSRGELLPHYTLTDLFCEAARAEELVALCNALELDPIHLLAVAEDALI